MNFYKLRCISIIKESIQNSLCQGTFSKGIMLMQGRYIADYFDKYKYLITNHIAPNQSEETSLSQNLIKKYKKYICIPSESYRSCYLNQKSYPKKRFSR